METLSEYRLESYFIRLCSWDKDGIVCIRVSTPSQKDHPFFLPILFINLQTVQAPKKPKKPQPHPIFHK